MVVSQKDWGCGGLILLGIILFLYGANYYDNLLGWLGVFFLVGGILGLILLYVYRILNKSEVPKS